MTRTLAEQKEANREAARRYRARHPEKVRETHRRYRARHPEKILEKQRLRKRRARQLAQAVKDCPCVDCGVQLEPRDMHFDHVRGAKLFCIGNAGNRSAAAIYAEIAKCDVRCCYCHAKRHGFGERESV